MLHTAKIEIDTDGVHLCDLEATFDLSESREPAASHPDGPSRFERVSHCELISATGPQGTYDRALLVALTSEAEIASWEVWASDKFQGMGEAA